MILSFPSQIHTTCKYHSNNIMMTKMNITVIIMSSTINTT